MSSSRTFALVASVCLACGGQAQKPEEKMNRWGRALAKGTRAPAWVDQLPENGAGRLYAVGRCGPTYWPQDAINNATEDARGKLALGLASHVEFLGANVETNTREKTVQINKEASDVVMQNSRIEATWTDESGERDEPGSVWALAVIDLDAARGKAGAQVQATSASWTLGSATSAPSWLDRLPGSKAKIFAAGYSGPTFRPEDAVQYASDAAVDNLATSLRSHVQAYNLLVETSTGLSVDEFSRTEDPDQAFKDLVKKNAKVDATWVDKDGLRAGDPPGAAWALASIDVQSAKGNYNSVENSDLGPALDRQGKAGTEPQATASAKAPAAPSSATTGSASATAGSGSAATGAATTPAPGDPAAKPNAAASSSSSSQNAVPASAIVK